ncbi:unnamed protein product, partial [marine sediment metagenome]
MKIIEHFLIIIKESPKKIIIKGYLEDVLCTKQAGCKEIRPVLWFDQGMFRMIPIQLIKNALDNLEMYKRISSKHTNPSVYITW